MTGRETVESEGSNPFLLKSSDLTENLACLASVCMYLSLNNAMNLSVSLAMDFLFKFLTSP